MTDLHHNIFCRHLFDRIKEFRDTSRSADETLNEMTSLQELTDDYSLLMNECKSPIEQMLGASLLFATDGNNPMKYHMVGPETLQNYAMSLACEGEGEVALFAPQVEIDKYQADFLIAIVCRRQLSYLAIECDGHDFHERTKEQASRDKKRDRVFTALDIPVLRFTGSDIHRKLVECVEEIECFVAKRMTAMRATSDSFRKAV